MKHGLLLGGWGNVHSAGFHQMVTSVVGRGMTRALTFSGSSPPPLPAVHTYGRPILFLERLHLVSFPRYSPLFMAARTHYRRKFWCDDLLSDSVNALCFSDDSRLTAATDSRGVLVVFDNQIGGPVHLAYLTPKVQVFSLLWRGASELFFGLSNGAVGALAFKSSGSQVRYHSRLRVDDHINIIQS